MPPREPDDALVVLFRLHAEENPEKTRAEGRPIFDEIEVCEIRSPGSKEVKVYPANYFCRWVVDPFTGRQRQESYCERFAHQYQQFKAKAVQTKSGTPLDYANWLTDGRRAELRAQNVYTIEALAIVDGNELKNLGPNGRDFKNRAIEYIEESKAAAPNKALVAELEMLRTRNALLEEDMVHLKTLRQRDEAEFEEMTDDRLRDYVTSQTGKAPHGTLPRKTLLRMAMDARPEKVA